MKLEKVVLVGFTKENLDHKYWKKLEAISSQIVFHNGDINSSLEDNPEADVLLVKLGAKIGKTQFDRGSNLKYIGMFGTGFGGIDADYGAKKGVVVTNISDYATIGVAEFTFGVLLEHMRRLAEGRKLAKNMLFSEDDFFSVSEISGKTFGVIGLGNIGKKVASMANCFGARVIYWSTNRKHIFEGEDLRFAELDDVMREADILSINVALNDKTKGLINSNRIDLVKSGSIIVNLSPMDLFDLKALESRLGKKDMTVIFDHTDELTKDQLELLGSLIADSEQLIAYPPIAYTTIEASARKQKIFIQNIESFIAGEPTNKVN